MKFDFIQREVNIRMELIVENCVLNPLIGLEVACREF